MQTSSASSTSQNPIKVGVVGLGRAGWNIHVAGMQRNAGLFQIVEVVDFEESRRAQAEKELGCKAYTSLADMLSQGEAELIVVATPNPAHEADALAVFAAGKDCICEKPMATSYEGALRVVEAAKKSGRKLFVHHQHLFGPEYQFIREIIESGLIGELQEIRYNWAGYARRNDWQTLQKNGGGLLNNHGPHALSTMLAHLGSPIKDVFAFVKHIKDAGDSDDHVHLMLRAENGRVGDAFLTTSCALPLPRFVVLGSTGTVVSQDGKTAKLRYYDLAQAPALEVYEGVPQDRRYGNSDVLPWQEEEREVAPQVDPGTFYQNVYAVLREGAPMVVTPESALEVSRVTELARKVSGF